MAWTCPTGVLLLIAQNGGMAIRAVREYKGLIPAGTGAMAGRGRVCTPLISALVTGMASTGTTGSQLKGGATSQPSLPPYPMSYYPSLQA